MKLFKFVEKKEYILAGLICFVFFLAYLILGFVKHAHFLSGYDLSVINQAVWEYSRFLSPNSTVHAYAFTPVYFDHVELILLLLSPFYWIHPNSETLIILQALLFGLSGIPVFLLARKYKINIFLSLSLLISYFTFFGVQNALWSDVHSLVFGASFLAFFIYFLDINKKLPAIFFFFLAITSKEDIALLTFFISFVYLILNRRKINLFFIFVSVIYSFFNVFQTFLTQYSSNFYCGFFN